MSTNNSALLNVQQVRLLHSYLESTKDAHGTKEMLARYPTMLDTYTLRSQFNVKVLRAIFSTGYIPSEEYIYRVCSLNESAAVRVLCEFDLFRKVFGTIVDDEDEIMVYAGRKEVADILLEYGIISNSLYQSLANVWEALKM